MIVSNEIECAKCGDRIFSGHRHDFKYCRCGAVAVDGGPNYLRRVGDLGAVVERSIPMPQKDVHACIQAVEWAKETHRNSAGVAFAVLRALRDAGYVLDRPLTEGSQPDKLEE